MSNIALGELREEVIYSMQQPHVRLHNMALKRDKKMVKKVLRNQARVMGAGTHYVLENDLLDVIIPSLKRASIRQFVNAYWNARPPHKSFFVEWDHGYLLRQLGTADCSGLTATEQKYLDHETVLAGVSSTYGGATKITHSALNPTSVSDFEETSIPRHQVIRFFTGQSATRAMFTTEANKEALQSKRTAIGMSPGELFQFDLEDLGEHDAKFGLVPDVLRSGVALFKEWFQLDDLTPYDGLVELAVSCLPSRHRVSTLQEPLADGTYGTPTQNFKGYEFIHFQVFIAAISLLNFDWVVNKEDGTIARGTKSINTEAFPQDLYKRVTINLPKDKAIVQFKKQKSRTRKFGTAEHVVRGHWREYLKTGKRIWVKEHSRGDEKYGTVTKDYVLAKRDNYLKPPTRLH